MRDRGNALFRILKYANYAAVDALHVKQLTLSQQHHLIYQADELWLTKTKSQHFTLLVTSPMGNISGTLGEQNHLQTTINLTGNNLHLGNLSIRHFKGDWLANITQKPKSSLHLSLQDVSINTYRIPNINLNAVSTFHHQIFALAITVSSGTANRVVAHINLPIVTSLPWSDQTIVGKVTMRVNQLSEFMQRIPEIHNLAAEVEANMAISGRILKPELTMTMSLKNGQVRLPRLGINVNAMDMHATYATHHPITLTGRFHSGKGSAELSATLDVDQGGLANLTLVGDQLELVHLREYKVAISPKLKMAYEKNKAEIRGKITVSQADITPTDFSNVVTLPDEVIFIGQKPPESFIPRNLAINVRITLGDHIYLSYANLKANLGGSIRISQVQGNPPSAVGELNIISGKYQAYGHLLTIKEGRLIYNGNTLTNPGLNIRAFKTVTTLSLANTNQFTDMVQLSSAYMGSNAMEVGIWVKGTLNNPRVSLYSNPSGIAARDILSYLVFGYPQSQISSASGLALLNDLAGNMNGDNQGLTGKMTNKVQDFLGLSEMQIGSTEYLNTDTQSINNTTTVSIGKNIGKKLSLHYTVGFFQPVQILSLKYLINQYFSIQSESSTLENGADLMFEIEKN